MCILQRYSLASETLHRIFKVESFVTEEDKVFSIVRVRACVCVTFIVMTSPGTTIQDIVRHVHIDGIQAQGSLDDALCGLEVFQIMQELL